MDFCQKYSQKSGASYKTGHFFFRVWDGSLTFRDKKTQKYLCITSGKPTPEKRSHDWLENSPIFQ